MVENDEILVEIVGTTTITTPTTTITTTTITPTTTATQNVMKSFHLGGFSLNTPFMVIFLFFDSDNGLHIFLKQMIWDFHHIYSR